MSDQPTARPRPPLLAVLMNYVLYVLMIGVMAGALFLAWPSLMAEVQHRLGGASIATPALATAVLQAAPVPPRATPLPLQNPGGSYNDAAAADAAYATAAAAPPQNVDTLPPGAPAPSYGQRTNDLAPAPAFVPTAEPIVQANDQFGSKRTAPVNIQETHQCLHGAVWVDDVGCQYPTPIGGE
jgi:hypothetical protein